MRYRDGNRLGKLIFTWAVSSAALGVAAWAVGHVSYSSYWALAGAGLVFALVSTYLKPVLVVLGFPFIIVTLGIGLFLINMALVWLTAALVPGFAAAGFWPIAKAAVVVWLVNMLLNGFWPDDRKRGHVSLDWDGRVSG